jgi:hypothetical protein
MNRRFLLAAISAMIWILASNESYASCITFEDVQAKSSRYTVDLDADGSSDLIFTTPSPEGFTPSGPPVSLTGISEPGLGGKVLSPKTGATPFETAEVIVEFLGGATDSLAFNFAVSGEIHSTWNAYIQLGTYEEGLISGKWVQAEKTLSESVPSGKIITVSEGFMEHSFARRADFALINFNTTSGGLFILDNFVGTFGTAEDPVWERAISVSPSNFDFGKAQVGTLSTPLELTVSSVGGADFEIEGLYISGQNASEFRMENDYCSHQVLFPGETSTVDVLFSPTSGGPKNANLVIPCNVPGILPLVVPLTGTGLTEPDGIYEEAVIIDDAYTMNYKRESETEFYVGNPVIYKVYYTITGNPDKRYKAIIIINSMGDKLREVKKHKPGSYTTKILNLADSDDVGTHTVTYNIKLRKRGLLDIDTDTSQITVNP